MFAPLVVQFCRFAWRFPDATCHQQGAQHDIIMEHFGVFVRNVSIWRKISKYNQESSCRDSKGAWLQRQMKL
uniref:Secreted protein n=1 Tax=Romanomermis culicivorax TaxID=13658 RepID=A0A915L058_ROMCU